MGSLITAVILVGIYLAGVFLTVVLSLGLMITTKGRMPPTDEGLWI